MPTVISYLDYFISQNEMPIEKFIDTLDNDYILNWATSNLGTEI